MTTHDEFLSPPERQAFWRWVAESVRPFAGWILLVLGALAIFLGWFGVSGQSLTAKQLPYLVSGGLTGVALIVVGAMFLATDSVRRQASRLEGIERKVDDLYTLLVLEPPSTTETPADARVTAVEDIGLVALPVGATFHRPTCSLVTGKADAAPVNDGEIAARGLKPCPVCDPTTAATSR